MAVCSFGRLRGSPVLHCNQRAGVAGTAGIGTGAVAGAFRENSDVLLRYQINAPPPTTAKKVKKTMRMPRQDFMRKFLRRSMAAS